MNAQLFPKPKRTWRLKQPRKDEIRWRAELAEARAAYLAAELEEVRRQSTAARARAVVIRRRRSAMRRALFASLVLVLIAIAGRWAGWLPIGGA